MHCSLEELGFPCLELAGTETVFSQDFLDRNLTPENAYYEGSAALGRPLLWRSRRRVVRQWIESFPSCDRHRGVKIGMGPRSPRGRRCDALVSATTCALRPIAPPP